MSEIRVRNYCTQGEIKGASLKGKTWTIPEGAVKPDRMAKGTMQASQLLPVLKEEKLCTLHE